MKTTTTDLAAMRGRITKLKTELQALRATARDQAQARAQISALVADLGAPITQRLRYAVQSGEMSEVFVVRPRPDGVVDVGPLLAALLGPDVLAAALLRYADELPPAADNAKRAARLADITAELDALEEAEEIDVERLGAQGIQADRRADARPEIVLKLRA